MQQKIDDEMSKNPKRIRADDQGVSSKIPHIKHILLMGLTIRKKLTLSGTWMIRGLDGKRA